MKAAEKTIQGLLHSSDQYVIPLFQRYFTWQRADWQQLWDDLDELLDAEGTGQRHFIGSVVLVPNRGQGGVPSFLVIDGQQRLITVSLLLAALRDAARTRGDEPLAGEIDDCYLVLRYKSGDLHYKLLPRLLDRAEYIALIDGGHVAGTGNIGAAYSFFEERLRKGPHLPRSVFEALTTRFDFVAITLEGENPFRIFESLNSRGIPLEQGDLIRNHVFMALPFERQEVFDREHWRPFEEHFAEDGHVDAGALAAFFRDALMSTGMYVPKKETYREFSQRYPESGFDPMAVLALCDEMAGYYDLLEGRAKHSSGAVGRALGGLRALNVTTSYPLLLRLHQLHAAGKLDDAGLCSCIDAVSGFVLRRFVCGEQSRGYGRWFCEACRGLERDPEATLLQFLRKKGWPSDEAFAEAFVGFALYQSKYARAVFEGLEQAEDARRLAEIGGSSIEHIMPESLDKRRDAYWIKALGSDWAGEHDRWRHTPGNLTFVHAEQRDFLEEGTFTGRIARLGRSSLRLNRDLREVEGNWDVAAIRRRGERLAKMAGVVWRGPADAPRPAATAPARVKLPARAPREGKEPEAPTAQARPDSGSSLGSSYRFGAAPMTRKEQEDAAVRAYLERQKAKPQAPTPGPSKKRDGPSSPRSYRYVREEKTLTTPVYVELKGKRHQVRFWNEVVRLAAREHFRLRGRAPKEPLLQRQQNVYVTDKRSQLRRPGPLGNGWYFERNLSAALACKVAETLFAEAGYRSSEFDIFCVPSTRREEGEDR